MTVNERVKIVRQDAGLTLEKFGERIGMKKNSLSQIETGKNALTEQVMKFICSEFSVSYDWLKNGEGEPYKSGEEHIAARVMALLAGDKHKKTKAFIKALARLDDSQLDAVDKYVDYLLEELDD